MTGDNDRIGPDAVCLAAIAGFVDAIAFLALGGFFAASMSADTTRLGVELAYGSPLASVAAAMIVVFVVGVIAGTIMGRTVRIRRRPALLAMVAILLALGAALSLASFKPGAVAATVLAMGVANTVPEDEAALPIGLFYVTAILAQAGDRLTTALTGGDRVSWLAPLLVWVGLVSGATMGSVLYLHFGLAALWIASGGAALLTATALRTPH